jgi:hypothetical protein
VDSFHTAEAIDDFRELPTTHCPRLEKLMHIQYTEKLFMKYTRFSLGVRDDLTTEL